jgi:hypothetical protein
MWEMPQGITTEAFKLLVTHINAHYKYGLVSNLHSLAIREKVIKQISKQTTKSNSFL